MTAPDISRGLMSQQQVADYLAISTREVRRKAADGTLTVVPGVTTRPRYLRAEVEQLVADAINKSA